MLTKRVVFLRKHQNYLQLINENDICYEVLAPTIVNVKKYFRIFLLISISLID